MTSWLSEGRAQSTMPSGGRALVSFECVAPRRGSTRQRQSTGLGAIGRVVEPAVPMRPLPAPLAAPFRLSRAVQASSIMARRPAAHSGKKWIDLPDDRFGPILAWLELQEPLGASY